MDDTSQNTEGKRYPSYVLAILTLVYAFNFIDRQILVILQESIKVDLDLSDTQLGLLTGFVFAIFYVTAGIPIARLADRSNRRNIVAISLTVWSGMTAISGLVQNYWQLVAARIGVGIGEAGGSPPSHSIISDYYPPEKRSTAISIYTTGVYFGILMGFLIGGWINETFGWRIAFFVVGLPGIFLAVIVRLTIKEPPRGRYDDMDKQVEKPSLMDAFKILWSKKSFRFLSIGTGLASFSGYGAGNFMPSFLVRIHDMSIMDIGFALSISAGIGGALGTFIGGWLPDYIKPKNKAWYMWIPSLSFLISLPFAYYAFLSSDTQTVLVVYFIYYVLHAFYLGPCIAVSHNMVPHTMRALVSAILFFILNLIGLGLGPLSVGLVSDYLQADYGVDALRYSMIIITTIGGLSAVCFYFAGKHLAKDLNE
jgi:MFS family permease